MRYYNDKGFKKVGLFKNKELGSKEKSFEIYISNHYIFENPISWILMYDISDSLEKEKIKEDYRVKANLVAKISHEFTTPVMSIIEVIKSTAKNSYDSSVKSNLKGVKNLCEYLFVLIKELSYCINTKKNVNEISKPLLTFFDLVKLSKKIRNIIFDLRDMNDMKSKSIALNLKIFSELLNLELDQKVCKVIVFSDFEAIKHFLINLFIITLKVVFRGEINLILNLKEMDVTSNEYTVEILERLPSRKIKVTIECDTNFNINTLKDNQEESDNYNRIQGMDISYNLCKKYSDELGLNLNFEKENETLIINFEIDCKVVIADPKSKLNEYDSPQSYNTIQNRSGLYKKDSQLNQFINKYMKSRVKDEIEEEEVCIDGNSDQEYQNFGNFSETHNSNNQLQKDQKSSSNFAKSKQNIKISDKQIQNIRKIERNHSHKSKEDNNQNIKIRNQINVVNLSFPLRKESKASKLSKFFTHKLSCKKIIIADDMTSIRTAVKNILLSALKDYNEEYDIIECTDGIEILNQIYTLYSFSGDVTISCIITDQFMNFMNGSDIIKIIHSLVKENKIRKIPIIVATAFQDEININNILSSNPDKILNKPLNKAMLLSALKEIL